MNAILDRIIREFFPDTHIPHWKKWVFRAASGNKVFSRLVNDERLINRNGVYWVSSVVDFFNVRCETEYSDFNNIPRQGATVVISDHPTVMDGIALIRTIAQIRKGMRIVANRILPMILPQIAGLTIDIENMAGEMNHKKFKEINNRLEDGGVLTIYPTGKLASWSLSGLQEHQWSPGFLQLAMRDNAVLVPVRVMGSNSRTYYLAATAWRQLSNVMIIREALRHHGKTTKIKVGQ